MKICIYGASSNELERSYYTEAEALGRQLVMRGHGLVFGGGAGGLMGAAARGARSMGGIVLGVAPEFFNEPGILFEECTDFIFTETMRERKQIMDEYSQAIIVLPGGIGTYEEFFEMLTLKQLGRHNKPIAILNTNGYYDGMAELLRETAQKGFMSEACLGLYEIADTPARALSYIEEYKDEGSGSIVRLRDYNK